eukprot:2957085-Lingulodinium_polyedra.AAC.1
MPLLPPLPKQAPINADLPRGATTSIGARARASPGGRVSAHCCCGRYSQTLSRRTAARTPSTRQSSGYL